MVAGFGRRFGFTLVELTVVVGVIALLLAILLPSLSRARQQARIVTVHSDLRQINIALDAYHLNNGNRYPPTRAGCSNMIAYQLPIELARKRYLPRKEGKVLQADMVDIFNAPYTYKYRAPGTLIINEGSTILEDGSYICVPDDYPKCRKEIEKDDVYNRPEKSPVQYAIWSMGPDPLSNKFNKNTLDSGETVVDQWYFPLQEKYWCMHPGDTGIITHSKNRNGHTHLSP